jgi:hypothetical protein
MILAAHQPYFLPWPAYFDKIARAERFVLLDHVQYGSESFQNRNRIKIHSGAHWITVPVARHGLTERICDKQIANGTSTRDDWQRRLWRTIEESYRRAPHFASYREPLADVFHRRWTLLADLDLALIELVMRWLGIDTPLVRSTTLAVSGQKTELIGDLCRLLGADTYLSGVGGSRSYLDESLLSRAGVAVRWHNFAQPPYRQLHPAAGFVANLSVLDLLLNCGPESADLLRRGGDAAASAA